MEPQFTKKDRFRSISHFSLGCLAFGFALSVQAAPRGAVDNQSASHESGDYFPTYADTLYETEQREPLKINDPARRHRALISYRKDTGFPEYRDERFVGDYYDGTSLDYPEAGLGFEYPGDVGFDHEYSRETSFVFEGELPLLTRNFDPDEAHLKIGGAYFDLLSVSSGVLYSDYEGNATFREGEEDGLLGYVGFRFRTSIRIKSSLFITIDGEVIYLPGANRVAFRAGNGNSLFRLSYEFEAGMWDLQIYDDFGIYLPNGFINDGAFDRAGRYQFGFLDDRRSNDLLSNPFFANTVGVRATRLLTDDWRLGLEADHSDYWRDDDRIGSDHFNREHIGAQVAYEGRDVPFSPVLRYDAYSFDEFDSLFHRLYASGSGRITETVRLRAGGGRLWSSGYDREYESWIWNVGLTHDLSEYTTHSVTVGQDLQVSELTVDTLVSEYLRYQIRHRVSSVLSMNAFAQWSRDEFLVGDFAGGEFDTEIFGGFVNYVPLPNAVFVAGATYQDRVRSTTGDSFERWLYFLNFTTQIYNQTSLYTRAQYEETNFFDERLMILGVRRYF